jgi:hypothetical protein
MKSVLYYDINIIIVNHIGDDGAKWIAQALEKNNTLTTLDLRSNMK